MSFDEIAKLPVKQIVMADAVLFLWVTNPLLPKQLAIMKAWGFEYKTLITWEKTNGKGGGYWFRGKTEHLALGVRGKVKSFRSMVDNIHRYPVSRHSEKPEGFRRIIEKVTPNLNPKLELFARHSSAGWDIWGNEGVNEVKPLDALPVTF
jgi:N6-adenosine-specific RNA methylase IME4